MRIVDRYRDLRRRMVALGRSVDDDGGAATPVPATPEWTVRDHFAHMAGVADDLLAGRLEGVATDPWTAAQLARREGRALAELLDEWASLAPALEELLETLDDAVDPRLVIDLWTHDQDVRAAVGASRPVDDPHVGWIVSRAAPAWVGRAARRGLPALEVRCGEEVWGPEDGPAEVVLVLEPYEAARLLTGRRSAGQYAALDWSGTEDPLAYAPVVVAFSLSEHDQVDPPAA